METFTAQYHRDEALHHADEAGQALANLLEDEPSDSYARRVNQRIGVNLKLADLHARLALVAVQLPATPPPTPPARPPYKTPEQALAAAEDEWNGQ